MQEVVCLSQKARLSSPPQQSCAQSLDVWARAAAASQVKA